MGITGVALNNIAQFTGLQLSTVSNDTLIATTTPAVTALVALIFLRERLLPIELLGILLKNNVIIVEGIHGLNPKLTQLLPPEALFKILY